MSCVRSSSIKCPPHWVWNDLTNELNYLSRGDNKENRDVQAQRLYSALETQSSTSSKLVAANNTNFKKTVGSLSQQKFRKYFRREVKMNEPEVVTLQDVKDVAIYTCKVSLLTPEFISYFHSQSMDNFLRSLIIYFQYYFQVWNKMQLRRIESKRKLRQPIVTELENIVRDDLADLRSMVARCYSVILLGIGDAKRFHHMNNKNNDSFSDRDRRLFECLMMMTLSVIWIALSRKFMTLIEKELNRILRTNIFSPSVHSKNPNPQFDTIPEEDRIFIGKAFTVERKLLHRSPAVQELIFDNHDYRILAIGVTDTECPDPRQIYLETAYTAPEELLFQMEIPVGLLGVPRKFLDAMLKVKEPSTNRKRSVLKPLPEFVLPPKIPSDAVCARSKTLKIKSCRYPEPEATKFERNKQCNMWRKYVETKGQTPTRGVNILDALKGSSLALRTSVGPAAASAKST